MHALVRFFIIAILFGFVTIASAELPPEIVVDKYLIHVEQLHTAKDYVRVFEIMDELIEFQKAHNLTLPDNFHFKYARMAMSADSNKIALDSINKYLLATGRRGEFYKEALALLLKADSTKIVAEKSEEFEDWLEDALYLSPFISFLLIVFAGVGKPWIGNPLQSTDKDSILAFSKWFWNNISLRNKFVVAIASLGLLAAILNQVRAAEKAHELDDILHSTLGTAQTVKLTIDEIKSDVPDLVDKVNKSVGKVNQSVAGVKDSVGEVNKSVGKVNQSVAGVKDSVGEVNKSVGKVNQSVAGVKDSVGEVNKSVGKVNQSVAGVKDSVGEVNKSVGKVNQSVAGVKDSVGEVNKSVGKVNQSVAGVKDSVGEVNKSVGKVNQSVAGVKDSVGEVNKSVGKVNQSVAGVKDSVGEVNKSVGKVNQSIGSLKSELTDSLSKLLNEIKFIRKTMQDSAQ